MLKKYHKYFPFLLCLALLPSVVWAAFNTVTVDDEGVDIYVTGNGLTYKLKRATRVESFTVYETYIDFVMQDNSLIDLYSEDASELTVSEGCSYLEKSCSSASSAFLVQCREGITIRVTPGAAGSCTGDGLDGGSGSAPSSAPSAPGPSIPVDEEDEGEGVEEEVSEEVEEPVDEYVPIATEAVTVQLNTPTPVSVGSVSHTVTVGSASENSVLITIESDPIVLTLIKNQETDIDTDGDGVKDLRAVYLGLVGGVPKIEFSEIELSPASLCPLTVNKPYKHPFSPAVYYITTDCTKRAFKSAQKYLTYFTSWSDVRPTSKSKIDSVANDTLGFMPWGHLYDPQYGALVKIVTDPKVYLLLGNEKYWITSEEVFEGLNYKWNWIEDIDERLLDKYITGSLISYTSHHPNYTLVKYADSPAVYRLEPDPNDSSKQVKRYIVDEEAFESLKFRWDRIVTVGSGEVYEDGENMQGSAASETASPVESTTTETAAEGYTFTSFLNVGSEGAEVTQLQLKLKELGHFSPDVDATGYYGTMTYEAVKQFQEAGGIDAVGYVGPSTRELLNK